MVSEEKQGFSAPCAPDASHPDSAAQFLDAILTAIPAANRSDFLRALADQLDGATMPE